MILTTRKHRLELVDPGKKADKNGLESVETWIKLAAHGISLFLICLRAWTGNSQEAGSATSTWTTEPGKSKRVCSFMPVHVFACSFTCRHAFVHELVGVRTSVMMQGACLLLQNVCLYSSFWKTSAADAAFYESRNSHVCCHGSGLLIVDGNDRRETKMNA